MEEGQDVVEQKSTSLEAPISQGHSSSTRNDIEKGPTKTIVAKEKNDAPVAPTEPPEVVNWDGSDDPNNPMNWSSRKKWITISLVSYITFVT